jgi:large subunit ribosomal protein L28
MSRKCSITGKRRQKNNNVSHSNIKSRKFSEVNIKNKSVFDPATGKTVKVKLAAATLRTLDKVGSLSKLTKKLAK